MHYLLIIGSLIGLGSVGYDAVISRDMLSEPLAALLSYDINARILVPIWAVIALAILLVLNLVYLAYSSSLLKNLARGKDW